MNRPKLILIMGVPSTGKTTLGKHISNQLGYSFLDNDTISSGFTNELCRLNGISTDDRDSDLYLEKVKPIERTALFATLIENLQIGVSVVVPTVLTGYHNNPTWLEDFLLENNLLNVAVRVIQITTPDEVTLFQRLVKRNHPKDQWKLNNWEQYYPTIKDYSITWDVPILHVNNDNLNIVNNPKRVLDFVKL